MQPTSILRASVRLHDYWSRREAQSMRRAKELRAELSAALTGEMRLSNGISSLLLSRNRAWRGLRLEAGASVAAIRDGPADVKVVRILPG